MSKENKNNQIDQVATKDDKTPQEGVQSVTEQSTDKSIQEETSTKQEKTTVHYNSKGEEVIRDENGRVISGTPNPNGRPKGALSFSTKFYKALEKFAEQNGKTLEQEEEEMLIEGFKRAKKGDYRFFQDLNDRVYGKPKQVQEIDFNDNTPTLAQRPDLNDAQRKVLMKLSDDVLAAEGLETYEKD